MTNTFSAVGAGTKNAYRSVMSIEHSPLKNFDPVVAHMMFQILAFVWAAIFSVMIGSYMAFGISAILHMLFISGVFITAMIFREGNKRSAPYRATKYNGRTNNGEHE